MQTSVGRVYPYIVALLGTISLFVLHNRPHQQDQVIALLFLPTTSALKVIEAITAFDLPIRAIRWKGRLVEIDVSGIDEENRQFISRRLPIFSVQVSTRPTALCIAQSNLKDAQ